MKAYIYDKENEFLGTVEGKDWDDCIDKVVEQIPEN